MSAQPAVARLAMAFKHTSPVIALTGPIWYLEVDSTTWKWDEATAKVGCSIPSSLQHIFRMAILNPNAEVEMND